LYSIDPTKKEEKEKEKTGSLPRDDQVTCTKTTNMKLLSLILSVQLIRASEVNVEQPIFERMKTNDVDINAYWSELKEILLGIKESCGEVVK